MTAAQTPPRAAVYTRISDDRRGTEAGVKRQREDCLAVVQREGWVLVHDGERDTFEDNDISAFSGRKRPAYLRLIDAMKAGEVDVVVSWHPDRLHRSPRELEDWIALQEATGTRVLTVKAGEWDLSTPAGRMGARNIGNVAAYESEVKSDRVRRAMQQRAEGGLWHGALRVYGYRGTRNADGSHTIEVVPEEAAVIREAAGRILGGESLLSVVRDLNRRQVPTVRGKAWSRNTLRGILIAARTAGWRERTEGRTNVSAGQLWPGGEFVAKGNWEGILTRRQVERLRTALTDPARRLTAPARTYLLSGGLALCQCGAALRGRPRYKAGPDAREYACASPASNGKGCGRVAIAAEPLEDYLVGLVRQAVEDGLPQRLHADKHDDTTAAVHAVADLEADLAALAKDHGAGRITRSEWMAAREPLTARLARAQADLSRREGSESAALLAGGVAAWDERWRAAGEAGQVDRQRAMLRAALVSVTVSPALVRGLSRFDRRRVTADWRA